VINEINPIVIEKVKNATPIKSHYLFINNRSDGTWMFFSYFIHIKQQLPTPAIIKCCSFETLNITIGNYQ